MQAASPLTGSVCVDVDCDPRPLPGARAAAPRPPGRVFRRPRRHPDPSGRRRGHGGLPLPPQCQHALALSQQRGDRRDDRRARGGARRLPRRHARGDRVRRQHDHPNLPPGARPRPRLGAGRRDRRSRSSTITRTSPPGRRWRGSAASRSGRSRSIAETGQLDWPRSSRPLPEDRLLAVGAASNALGTISDVTRACALARSAGALSFVDAVHYAPHHPVDVAPFRLRFPRLLAIQVLRPPPWRTVRAAGGRGVTGRPRSSPRRPTPRRSGWRPEP